MTPAFGSIYVQIASLKIVATVSVSLDSKMFKNLETSATVGRDQPEIFASFTVEVFTARMVLETLALRLVSMAIKYKAFYGKAANTYSEPRENDASTNIFWTGAI